MSSPLLWSLTLGHDCPAALFSQARIPHQAGWGHTKQLVLKRWLFPLLLQILWERILPLLSSYPLTEQGHPPWTHTHTQEKEANPLSSLEL